MLRWPSGRTPPREPPPPRPRRQSQLVPFARCLALALLILAWSLAFKVVEDRSFIDAIYYTFVTVTTVGYGDIHPESNTGKMMAILIILTGTGMFGGGGGTRIVCRIDTAPACSGGNRAYRGTGVSVSGAYTCTGVTSYNSATRKMGTIDVTIRFTAETARP